MNHNTLFKHYRILKHLVECSKKLDQSAGNPEIKFKMMWELGEFDEKVIRLHYAKDNASIQMSIIDPIKHDIKRIVKIRMAHNNHYYDKKNYLSYNGNGFTINGSDKIRYTELNAHEHILLDPLPLETAGSLVLRDSLEEIDFQYNTLYNFTGNAFQMYCIFSMLFHIDNITKPFYMNSGEEVLMNVELSMNIPENIIDDLAVRVEEFHKKLHEDL
ncbi:hypothetical protein [Salmonella enterica]|uniref:hypothetical protein n=1 Tax=Salmonella enterica TaxID=28901 RepID=UPI003A81296B